jgi:hypothetical protein
MTTIVTEFGAVDPVTGDVMYPPLRVSSISGTASVTLLKKTKVVALTTDSSTVTFNADGRTAVAADMAPPARGFFLLRFTSHPPTQTVLTFANA